MSLFGLLGAVFTGGRLGGGTVGPTGGEEIFSWRDARANPSKWGTPIGYDQNTDPYYQAQAQHQQEIWRSQERR